MIFQGAQIKRNNINILMAKAENRLESFESYQQSGWRLKINLVGFIPAGRLRKR
jgi:hypothetical protein